MAQNKKNQQKFSKEPFRKSKSIKRILTKKSGKVPIDARKGTIYLALGSNYKVKDEESEEFVECILGGTVITPYENINVAAVGDKVHYQLLEQNNQGVILEIRERYSKLSRESVKKTDNEQIIAANIDQILIFMAVADPYYNKGLIDRYLISSEMYDIPTIICFNKIELMDLTLIKEDLQPYEDLDYGLVFISMEEKINLAEIESKLKGKTTLVTGPSGVGKSTFINHVLGEEVLAVGKVSDKHMKGKHTTSFVQMFDVNEDTRIVDSPGLRELAIWNFEKLELQMYFKDFTGYREECKFTPCTHTHEPGCMVKEAVEEGEIDIERYQSYLSILETL
ncbi:MAG: ribosome small subunit-dependent GTPase A [Ignavibacteriae bacterium HGW-Ignavibacteriae-4]|nr:MAG: ribosome small subunit-dependent GTPase A [Ignavibacteriae bacterium HGW-Ignavibacteriae-4]